MSKVKSSKKSKASTHVTHPFAPVYSSTSKVLILGTIPSPSSRKNEFYYMHPQNRFWLVMQKIFDVEFKYKNNEGPKAINERKEFLLNHDIAVWDVIKSCDIIGAGDSSIKNAKENDFHEIFEKSNIKKVFCTGFKVIGQFIAFKPATIFSETLIFSVKFISSLNSMSIS